MRVAALPHPPLKAGYDGDTHCSLETMQGSLETVQERQRNTGHALERTFGYVPPGGLEPATPGVSGENTHHYTTDGLTVKVSKCLI